MRGGLQSGRTGDRGLVSSLTQSDSSGQGKGLGRGSEGKKGKNKWKSNGKIYDMCNKK